MRQLVSYLNFSGNCRQALDFYADALGGQIKSLQTFGEAPMAMPAGTEHFVMHAEFEAEGVQFFAADAMPGQPVTSGTQISLMLNFSDLDEQAATFERLGTDGTVTMPLENVFWGACFGTITDQFGINWMLHATLPQPATATTEATAEMTAGS